MSSMIQPAGAKWLGRGESKRVGEGRTGTAQPRAQKDGFWSLQTMGI